MSTHPVILICVVDDDDAVRDSIKVLLESAGYEVRQYESGAQFLNERALPPRFILLCDLHMPDLSGIDVMERLRGRGLSNPAIVITGRADALSEERLTRLGVLAVLHKPVTEDDLLIWIEKAAKAV